MIKNTLGTAKKRWPIGFLSCFLLLLVFQAFKSTQFADSNEKAFFNKANLLNLKFPLEKIYLHLDRSSYLSGEDIWFKAYLLNSPISESNVYIEILNSAGTVIQKKIVLSQGGLSYGDFHLPDTISTGIYQLRAYTNWMRNFDIGCFFRKNIIISNLADKEVNLNIEKPGPADIDLQFFPEGGTFVANLKNRVAFKAVDQNGKGLEIEGDIFDNRGVKVTTFKSLRKGMGCFELEPKGKLKYTAKLSIDGARDLEIDLPEAQENGIIMRIESVGENINFRIEGQSSPDESEDTSGYFLVGRTRGIVFYQKEIKLKNGISIFDIGKNKMPTGIVQFSLFGKDLIPCCERLVFINHHDFINVDIKPDKPGYKPREKIQFDISTFTSKGLPCFSNLSISVFNPDSQLKLDDYPNNILTQFLLGSELKGSIEDPAFYFKDDSLSTLLALDNLMLTQGYRYFKWEEIREDKVPEIVYPPLGCIQLEGTVKSVLLSKPVPNCKVTMMTVKSLLDVQKQNTDSAGRFLFSNFYFYDTLSVVMKTVNSKDRQNCWIELDNKSNIPPKSGYLPVYYQNDLNSQIKSSPYISELKDELIKRKWRITDTIMLEDVNVLSKKQKKDDGHVRFYNEADFVFDMSKQDDVVANVYDAIDGRLPGVRFEQSENKFFYRGYPVLMYLDGIRVDDELLSTFSSRSFDKIELIKTASSAGVNYPGGILYFYTKRGAKFENIPLDEIGMKNTKLIGYSVIRKFYSPVYENPEKPAEKPDSRSTLYWNPIVRTDSTGMAHVAFYNSDDTGDMHVIIEGITGDGKLCRGTGTYSVKH